MLLSCILLLLFTNLISAAPLSVVVNSPLPGDVVGVNGSGFVVDIAIDAVSAQYNDLLNNDISYLNDPVLTNTTFHTGTSYSTPGLVVLLNTSVAGPYTNLAGLFQVNTFEYVQSPSGQYVAESYNVWLAGAPKFGTGASTLTVYYVNGTAPTTIDSSTVLQAISNVVSTVFTIASSSAPTTTNTTSSATLAPGANPVQVTIQSPGQYDLQGNNGVGFLIDLFTTSNTAAQNNLLSATNGYVPHYNSPSNTTAFRVGSLVSSPGLVVLLSTTTSKAPLNGPDTNLAGLFQITGIEFTSNGSLAQVWNSWIAGKALFGVGVNTTLTAYVVNGTAPNVVDANTQNSAISNIAQVNFYINGPNPTSAPTTTATPTATPAPLSSSAISLKATLAGAIVVVMLEPMLSFIL